MDVTEIPFAKHIGIERKEEGTLKLDSTQLVQNHMQTIHASAQFALAETQSGLFLELEFPELEEKVIALLRASTVKYKHPASTQITAHASLDADVKEKFETQFSKKGRASITVMVELRDEVGVVTMTGEFGWFVQKLEA